MKIITGKTGKPHVTSADDRALHRAEWDGDGFLMYTKRLSQGHFVGLPATSAG